MIAKSTIGPTTELNGTPRHPLDPTRTPGYSSAGEAIIVSSGASAFGIGSDSGGSIRFPAHCCGLVGLRPTFGRVPVTGHFPRVGPLYDGRSVIGPLARSVDDVRLVLPIIAGPDGRDPTCPPVALGTEPQPRGLRIAVHRQPLAGPLRGDVGRALDAAVASIEHAGCIVSDAEVLDVEQSLDITRRYWHRAELATGAVESLLSDWDRVRVRAMRLLDRFDAIVSPAAPFPAPLLGEVGPGRDDDANWTYMLAPSLWGWPAIVVPAGRSDEGLPLGVQIVAGPWNEPTCIALANVVESSSMLRDV